VTKKRRRLAADAWGALLQVHAQLVPVLDKRMQAASGLPLSWYDVLLELQAAPDGRLTMSALGQQVVLSRTRVSRLVDELVVAGLVAREAHPTDRRSSYAVVTAAGRERFRGAAPGYLAGIEEHFAAGLTDRELGVLVELLGRVRG
jgi:DNA-binding MarR family transcriptional regulator